MVTKDYLRLIILFTENKKISIRHRDKKKGGEKEKGRKKVQKPTGKRYETFQLKSECWKER